jgi:hypothetical protein
MFVSSQYLPRPHLFGNKPSWRWLRAGYLLDHGRGPLYRDEDLTRQVWQYRRELRRCECEGPAQQLAQAFPDLAAAHQMQLGGPLVRWEVEARLLAGQDDGSIAARCDIPASVVGAYHDVFFDVRSALKADMYILCDVIGWRFWPLVSPDDHEKLLKVYGYDYGEHGVDAYLAYLRRPPQVPASLAGLDQTELNSLQDRLRTRLNVLLMTTPAEVANPQAWMQMRQQFTAATRQTASIESQIQLDAAVIAMLTQGAPVSLHAAPDCAHSGPVCAQPALFAAITVPPARVVVTA